MEIQQFQTFLEKYLSQGCIYLWHSINRIIRVGHNFQFCETWKYFELCSKIYVYFYHTELTIGMNITYDNENPDQGKVKIEIVQNMYESICKIFLDTLNNLNL